MRMTQVLRNKSELNLNRTVSTLKNMLTVQSFLKVTLSLFHDRAVDLVNGDVVVIGLGQTLHYFGQE